MPLHANNNDNATLAQELDDALATLDDALLQAGRSVAIIRRALPQFTTLDRVVHEMEAAMTRARQQLDTSTGADTPLTGLRSVPVPPVPDTAPQDAYDSPDTVLRAEDAGSPDDALATPVSTSAADQDAPEDDNGAPENETAPAEEIPQQAEQRFGPSSNSCLRLEVASRTGSLDLKAVDGSVSENPAVLDVALLDYDGRQATLKLWVNDSSDPEGVRDAVISSLRNHLGDESQAIVTLTFESGSAA